MINALVLSLKELLLMSGILSDVSAFIAALQSMMVKVGALWLLKKLLPIDIGVWNHLLENMQNTGMCSVFSAYAL